MTRDAIGLELWSYFTTYVVPVLAAALIATFSRLAGFAFSEIFLTRRLLTLAIVTLIVAVTIPSLTGWAALCVLLLQLVVITYSYAVGPRRLPHIRFAGLFALSATTDTISHSARSHAMSMSYFSAFVEALSTQRVRFFRPLKADFWMPPKAIVATLDFSRLTALTGRYAGRSLACVWGLLGPDGDVASLTVSTRDGTFHGGRHATELFSTLQVILQARHIDTNERLSLHARALASIFGHSWCADLLDAGQSSTALAAAVDSRRCFESVMAALATFESPTTPSARDRLESRLLPMFVVEEARARLCAGAPERAVRLLVDSLLLNLHWPLADEYSFTRYYVHRYAFELAHSGPTSLQPLQQRIEHEADIARLGHEPSLELLISWLAGSAPNLLNVHQLIEDSFGSLAQSFPQSPFVYLYWADALKLPARILEKAEDVPGSSRPWPTLPTEILDRAIEKCEIAQRLAPHLSVISAKLAAMYLASSCTFPVGSPEEGRRAKLARGHMAGAGQFFDENFADVAGPVTADDLAHWLEKTTPRVADTQPKTTPIKRRVKGARRPKRRD